MTQNADNGECHAGKVAKRVAHKHSTRVFVVDKKRQRTRYEGHNQIH